MLPFSLFIEGVHCGVGHNWVIPTTLVPIRVLPSPAPLPLPGPLPFLAPPLPAASLLVPLLQLLLLLLLLFLSHRIVNFFLAELVFLSCFCYFIWDRSSLCSPGCRGTYYVDQVPCYRQGCSAAKSLKCSRIVDIQRYHRSLCKNVWVCHKLGMEQSVKCSYHKVAF